MLATSACGGRPDPEIAVAFVERLRGDAPGWSPRPCADRAARLERLAPVVPVVHDLTGRIRRYDDRLPPASRARVRALDLVGRAADYRCVVQDFPAVDLDREANFLAGQHNFANLYLLEARERLDEGDDEQAWALALEALELFRDPLGHQLGELLELVDALDLLGALIARRAPPPAPAARLAAAIDATRMSRSTLCAAVRHDLLHHAAMAFAGHLGRPERNLVVKRFGRAYARLLLESGKPGLHDRAGLNAWAEVYDVVVPACAKVPLGRLARQAAPAVDHLSDVDRALGTGARTVLDRMRIFDAVAEAQRAAAASLRDGGAWPRPRAAAQHMPSPYAPAP